MTMPGDDKSESKLVDEIMEEGLAYDPAGLAAKYGVDSDGEDADLDSSESDCCNIAARCTQTSSDPRAEGPGSRGITDNKVSDANVQVQGANNYFGYSHVDNCGRGDKSLTFRGLHNRNVTLFEALKKKNRQVEELGTMIEALQPVPGLDPDAFFAVLRGQGAGVREKGLDYRDVKIVQMAKRSRVLSARLDGEKTRCLKARREVDVLARELEVCRRELELISSAGARMPAKKSQQNAQAANLYSSKTGRVIGDEGRLRRQVVVLRNKLQEAQEEVKKLHRALSREIGGTEVELNRTLSGEGGWKGRARQIVVLKARVKHLEEHSKNNGRCQEPGHLPNGNRSRQHGRNDIDTRVREEIHFIERQRGHVMEQLEKSCSVLHQETESLRGQTVAKGARVAGLKKVNAHLRDRVKMLLAKSDTDDRLVDILRCEIQVLRKAAS